MGFNPGPASVRLTSAILTFVAFMAVACLALAQTPDFRERDLSPPARPRAASASKGARLPAKQVRPAAYNDEQGTSQDDNDDEATEENRTDDGRAVEDRSQETASGKSSAETEAATGDLSYEIREGDSVGALSAMFHIPAEEIFRHNHLREQSTLHIGQVLRIPNPYVAQVKELQRQVGALTTRNQEQQRKIQDSNSKESASSARIAELGGINRALEHDVMVLPWWRRATTVAVAVAVVMLGIAIVSLFQWFLIRLRFAAVAGANEKLAKLDQRYRVLLARAELRLQQLYGRRRAAGDSSTQARSPEDFELEHLGHEVKDVLEQELNQLGVQLHQPAHRSRLREWLISLGAPMPVRSDRR